MNAQKKVLVVEDSPDNRRLAEKILAHYNFSVVAVEDGEKAIAWCQENTPDAILMDISLPGIDGLETTRQIRQMDRLKDLPIIVLTAHITDEWIEKSKQAGGTDYLAKPFMPNRLVEILLEHTAE